MLGAPDPAIRLLGPALPWDAEADDRLVCRAVRQETHDVRTFVLSAPEPRRFVFDPGQFLTFAFEIEGETVHRCYTIASAPTRPDAVSITVKRVAGGPVSNWLHDTLKPGDVVRALGPMGDFSCFRQASHSAPRRLTGEADPSPPHPEGDSGPRYLFLSGGSGITPLMSMARAFHDLAVARDIVFVHNARTPADIVFRAELAVMAAASPSLRVVPVCEADAPGEPWTGFRGRISAELLALACPDFMTRDVYVCGPSAYMAAVRTILGRAGFDLARHHEESFDFAELSRGEKSDALEAEAELDAVPAPVPVFRVEFAKTRRAVEVRADQTVLDAARRQGIRLPSSCTKGLCGTCKSKILSGTVDMTHAGGIRQREIDAGLALLCCSKPTSDLVVDR